MTWTINPEYLPETLFIAMETEFWYEPDEQKDAQDRQYILELVRTTTIQNISLQFAHGDLNSKNFHDEYELALAIRCVHAFRENPLATRLKLVICSNLQGELPKSFSAFLDTIGHDVTDLQLHQCPTCPAAVKLVPFVAPLRKLKTLELHNMSKQQLAMLADHFEGITLARRPLELLTIEGVHSVSSSELCRLLAIPALASHVSLEVQQRRGFISAHNWETGQQDFTWNFDFDTHHAALLESLHGSIRKLSIEYWWDVHWELCAPPFANGLGKDTSFKSLHLGGLGNLSFPPQEHPINLLPLVAALAKDQYNKLKLDCRNPPTRESANALANYIRSPNCALEVLEFHGQYIPPILANSLPQNQSLKKIELMLDYGDMDILPRHTQQLKALQHDLLKGMDRNTTVTAAQLIVDAMHPIGVTDEDTLFDNSLQVICRRNKVICQDKNINKVAAALANQSLSMAALPLVLSRIFGRANDADDGQPTYNREHFKALFLQYIVHRNKQQAKIVSYDQTQAMFFLNNPELGNSSEMFFVDNRELGESCPIFLLDKHDLGNGSIMN